MFWTIIIFSILAFVFFKLGVFAVLVTILALAFKGAIVVIAAMGLLMLYLQHRKQ